VATFLDLARDAVWKRLVEAVALSPDSIKRPGVSPGTPVVLLSNLTRRYDTAGAWPGTTGPAPPSMLTLSMGFIGVLVTPLCTGYKASWEKHE